MPDLFTIGYQQTTQPAVIDALREAGVTHLLDVRAVPQSRKPGFSKSVFGASLEAAGIRYTHLRGLGTPKAGRDAVRHGHPEIMHRIFRAHMAEPAAQADLARAGAFATAAPVCLLCFERDPAQCHRTLVAEFLGRTPRHLFA